MADEQKPIEPTAAELKAQIETLKTQISGMVPSKERDQLKLDLDLARAELAELKKEQEAAAAPKPKRRLLDHLDGLSNMFGGGK